MHIPKEKMPHFRLTCVSEEDGDDGACPSKHQTERQIMHWRSSFSFLRALAFIKRWFIFLNSVLYLSKICSPRPSEMGRICVARNPWAFWRLESFAVSSLPLMTWSWTLQPSVLSWSSAVRACALPLSLSQQTSKVKVGKKTYTRLLTRHCCARTCREIAPLEFMFRLQGRRNLCFALPKGIPPSTCFKSILSIDKTMGYKYYGFVRTEISWTWKPTKGIVNVQKGGRTPYCKIRILSVCRPGQIKV